MEPDMIGGKASLEAGIGKHVSIGAEGWAGYDKLVEEWAYGAFGKLRVHW
jgi:hypothetical protein